MAKVVDYGKKNLIKHRTEFKRSLYLLFPENKSDNVGCYCPECRKATWTSYPVPLNQSGITGFTRCPECGTDFEQNVVISQTSENTIATASPLGQFVDDDGQKRDVMPVMRKGAYEIPMEPVSRSLFAYENTAGDTTRVDDNVIVRSAIVYPSGKVWNFDTEYSKSYDFLRNRQFATKTRLQDNRRMDEFIVDAIDVFSHGIHRTAGKDGIPVAIDMSPINDPGINFGQFRSLVQDMCATVWSGCYSVYKELIEGYPYPVDMGAGDYYGSNWRSINTAERIYSHYVPEAYRSRNAEIYEGYLDSKDFMQQIASAVGRRFKSRVNPLYIDFFHNGLFLGDHFVGSDESNTEICMRYYSIYLPLMVKYPAVFEYVCDRTDARVEKFAASERARAAADLSYVARVMPDSARSKMFRESLEYVASQLSVVDINILNALHKCKDVNDMKDALVSYLPDTSQPEWSAGAQSLSDAFDKDMLGVANTCYTAAKLGIHDPLLVMKLVNTGADSPSVHPDRKYATTRCKRGLSSFPEFAPHSPKQDCFRSSGTIYPVQDAAALRYFRSYLKGASPSDFVDEMCNPEIWTNHYNNIVIYRSIMHKFDKAGKAGFAATKQSVDDAVHEIRKAQVRGYADRYLSDTASDITAAFGDVFGTDTGTVVSQLLEEIACDRKLEEMKAVYDAGGVKGVMSQFSQEMKSFPPYDAAKSGNMAEQEAKFKADPEKYVNRYFKNYKVHGKDDNMLLMAPDGMPLIEGRSVSDIKAQLGSINARISDLSWNCSLDLQIPYSDAVMALSGFDKDTGLSVTFPETPADIIHTCLDMNIPRRMMWAGGMFEFYKDSPSFFARVKDDLGRDVAYMVLCTDREGRLAYGGAVGPNSDPLDFSARALVGQWIENHSIVQHRKDNSEGDSDSFVVPADSRFGEIEELPFV